MNLSAIALRRAAEQCADLERLRAETRRRKTARNRSADQRRTRGRGTCARRAPPAFVRLRGAQRAGDAP